MRGKEAPMRPRIPLLVSLTLLLSGCAGPAAAQAEEVLTEPPALMVRCGEVVVEALRGSTSWSYDNGDGTWTSFEADSLHPLDEASRELMPRLVFPDAIETRKAWLELDPVPDTVAVRCWSDTLWGDTGAPAQEITVEDLTISLREEGCIYEVTAHWTSPESWGGTASYSFYAGPEAPQET